MSGICVLCKTLTDDRLILCGEKEYIIIREFYSAIEVPLNSFVCRVCIDKKIREYNEKQEKL